MAPGALGYVRPLRCLPDRQAVGWAGDTGIFLEDPGARGGGGGGWAGGGGRVGLYKSAPPQGAVRTRPQTRASAAPSYPCPPLTSWEHGAQTFQHPARLCGRAGLCSRLLPGLPTWSCTGEGAGPRCSRTVLPDHPLRWLHPAGLQVWQRQVTSWGWGPLGWGWASVPLQKSIWDYRARVVLTAPGGRLGEESLVDLVPSEAPLSQGAVQDRSTGTPQRAPSLLLLASRKSSPKARSLGLSTGGGTPEPPGSQAGCLFTGAVPLQLRGSPATLGFCFLQQWSVWVRSACGAGTGVLLLARGSWGTWLWLRNVRASQTEVGGR